MSYKKIEHTAAGRFKAMGQTDRILQACLGTCLGVALYDHAAKAGGLIHILLPEPLGAYDLQMPEKYASTGIPMLISALMDLGCTPGNLKAVIAGGALVGPVSRQDMGLDIGGRSFEVAQAVLRAQGIEITHSETGGFFSCTLELDMKTGQMTIEPAFETARVPSKVYTPPTRADILETISTLKPIPQTALKVLRMFQEDQHSFEAITRELSGDQVLSAQTLKICNSALFRGSTKIDTLKDAVLILGRDMLVKTVITAAVQGYYNQTRLNGYSLCRGGLFFHAVGVARMAEHLAETTGKVHGHLAYTAGLIHDIGKVVLDQFAAQSMPLLFRNLEDGHQGLIQSEKEILGITHCMAGKILAENWQFSRALTETVTCHHLPESAEQATDLVSIIYLADLVMEKFFAGFDLEKMPTQSLMTTLRRLKISIDDLCQLVDAIPLDAMPYNTQAPNPMQKKRKRI